MYTEFYSLTKTPFDLTPSLQFLYLSESHREALSLLTYGVIERKGFILLTGEVGAGKTTIVQALLAKLEKSINYVHISNPILTPEEFIEYVAFSVFDGEPKYESKPDFLSEFESSLRQWRKEGKTFVLIVDEAHTLSLEVMEEIRLLSNLTFADENLINTVLVGQPELNEKLADPACRALMQRINSRYDISPLDLDEVRNYMWTRLRVAGCKNPNNLFSHRAVDAIYRYSKGYPRMVNIISDNCLLLGYSKGKGKITAAIVEKSYRDMQLQIPKKEVEQPPLVLPTQPEQEDESVEIKRPSPYLKWALASLLLAMVMVLNLSEKGGKLFGEFLSIVLVDRRHPPAAITPERVTKRIIRHEIPTKPSHDTPRDSHVPHVEERSEGPTEPPVETVQDVKITEETEASDAPVPSKEVAESETQVLGPKEDFVFFSPLIIKRGDTLSKLALKAYGDFDNEILDLVRDHNPGIRDINLILVGQKLILPLTHFPRKNAKYTVHIASFKQIDIAEEFCLGLVEKGYEGYIIPTQYNSKEEIYRVTLGHFENVKEAKNYASMIIDNKISYYAEIVKLKG
jgi:general secretion pathway protein A